MTKWQPIETAPRDGAIFDAWLGETDDAFSPDSADIAFYCTKGTRRSPGWHWKGGKFRPYVEGPVTLTTFVQPTHWMPLPEPPE